MPVNELPNAFPAERSAPVPPGKVTAIFPTIDSGFSAYRIAEEVVKFIETEDPNINDMLTTFRRKVLIPLALNKEQKKLAFRPSSKEVLETDPIVVQLPGEKVRLEHIDRLRDQPNFRKTLFRLMDSAETDVDFDNTITLIEGTRGHRKVEDEWIRRLVKKVVRKDMVDELLRAFKRGQKTGFVFRRNSIYSSTFRFAIHLEGAQNGWDEASTPRALSHAEQMVLMMEREPHKSSPPETRDPWTIGAVLEPAAVMALRHRGGRDEDGKVAMYTERLMARLEEESASIVKQQVSGRVGDNTLARQLGSLPFASITFSNVVKVPFYKDTPFSSLSEVTANRARGLLGAYLIPDVLPIWHGLMVANKVLGGQMPRPDFATVVISEMESLIETAVTKLKETGADSQFNFALRSWEACRGDV